MDVFIHRRKLAKPGYSTPIAPPRPTTDRPRLSLVFCDGAGLELGLEALRTKLRFASAVIHLRETIDFFFGFQFRASPKLFSSGVALASCVCRGLKKLWPRDWVRIVEVQGTGFVGEEEKEPFYW